MKNVNFLLLLTSLLLFPCVMNAQITYTLIKNGGVWSNSAVWLPVGIPGAGDSVVIIEKTVKIISTQHTIAGLRLVNGTISFDSTNPTLTITGNAVWYDGEFDGGNGANGGSAVNSNFIIAAGATLVIDTDATPESHRFYEGLTVVNRGTIRHIGSTVLGVRGKSVVKNEGLYDITSDADFGGESFSGGTFVNTGTFRKSGGSDVTQFNTWWDFNNQGGTIEVQTGTLELACGGIFNGGTYDAAAGAVLNFFADTYTFRGVLTGAPSGTISVNGSATITADSATATLDFQGTGFQWIDGAITGGDTVIIPNGALLVVNGNISSAFPSLKGGTTIRNQGTIRQKGTQSFYINGGASIDNRSLFDVETDADFDGGPGTGGTFVNTGTFRKSGGNGVTQFSAWWGFSNISGGVVDAASGKLEYTTNGKFDNAQGAIIQGTDTIDVPSTFTNNGIVSPGNSAGTLTWIGNFLPSATSVFKVELGGLTPGSEHDRLNVVGSATLKGAIDISLINGFMPARRDSFVVLTTTGTTIDSFTTVNPQSGLYVTVKVTPKYVVIVVDSLVPASVENASGGVGAGSYELSQNYPNPFSQGTDLRFTLPRSSFVRVEVFNARGECVDLLVSEEFDAGSHNCRWDATGFAAGVYTCRVTAGDVVRARQMILVR